MNASPEVRLQRSHPNRIRREQIGARKGLTGIQEHRA